MSRLYPERPIVGVGVVVCREGEVLLVRRGNPPRQGEWSLPGGAQKVGETVFEAASREVLEETGLAVRVLGLADVVDFIERDEAGLARYHYTLVDVYAAWEGGEARPGDDTAEVAWVGVDDLPGFGLWSETERVMRLGHQRFRDERRGEAGFPVSPAAATTT